MNPLELWLESLKKAKLMRNKGIRRFQIIKGPLLRDAQKIYCAATFKSSR